MAGQRLTDKAGQTKIEANDLLMVVDVSDTSGSAAGTSKKTENKFVIQTDIVTVAGSAYHNLSTSPVTLVAAQGSGYAVIPISCLVYVDYGSYTSTDKINLVIAHDPTVATSYSWAYASSFMRNVATDATWCFGLNPIQTAASSIDNLPLYLYSPSNFNASVDWTTYFYITYKILYIA